MVKRYTDLWFDICVLPEEARRECKDFLEVADERDFQRSLNALKGVECDDRSKVLLRALIYNGSGMLREAVGMLEDYGEENDLYCTYNLLRLYNALGERKKVLECFERLSGVEKDRKMELFIENERGKLFSNESSFGEALDKFTRVIEGGVELADLYLEGMGYNNAGTVYLNIGNYEHAKRCFERSLELDTKLGDERGITIDRLNIGDVFKRLGLWREAERSLMEAVELSRSLDPYNNAGIVGECFINLGEIALLETDSDKAEGRFREVIGFVEPFNDLELIARGNLGLAAIMINRRDFREAEDFLEAAFEASREIKSRKYEAEVYALRGSLMEKRGKLYGALQNHGLASMIFRNINDRYNAAAASEAAGRVYLALGDNEKALEHLKRAREDYVAISYYDLRSIDELIRKASQS